MADLQSCCQAAELGSTKVGDAHPLALLNGRHAEQVEQPGLPPGMKPGVDGGGPALVLVTPRRLENPGKAGKRKLLPRQHVVDPNQHRHGEATQTVAAVAVAHIHHKPPHKECPGHQSIALSLQEGVVVLAALGERGQPQACDVNVCDQWTQLLPKLHPAKQ